MPRFRKTELTDAQVEQPEHPGVLAPWLLVLAGALAALRLIDQMFTVLTDAEWIWFSAPLYALAAQAYVQLAERARVQRRPEDAEAPLDES